MLFDELADKFEEWYRREKSPKTASCYTTSLKKLKIAYAGQEINSIRLRGRPEGFTTMDMRVLKRMLRLAFEWEYLEKVPVIHIPPDKTRTRFFSADELDALFNECYDEDMLMVLRVGMGGGLRKQNLLDLKWNQVDFENCLIKVIQKRGTELWVPVSESMILHLQRYRQSGKSGPEWVFPRHKNYSARLKSLCRRLGISNATFHTLRHTYASWLAMGGADIKTISELLGHTNIQTTARYLHISTEHKREAISVLPTVITE